MVAITSSANVPASAIDCNDLLMNEEALECTVYVTRRDKGTNCLYLAINFCIMAPVMPMQGMIDVIASASRQDLA
jgi:hypothetical protein